MFEYRRLKKLIDSGWYVAGHSHYILDTLKLQRGNFQTTVKVHNPNNAIKALTYAAKHEMVAAANDLR